MEPSLDLLPFPSLWMTRAAGSPFGPITELEVRGEDGFGFHGSRKALSGGGGLAGRFLEPSHWGPHTHPWMLALLAEESSQSHVLEGHVGTECLSAPLGQGGSPHPPSGGRSHSGSLQAGSLVPGQVGLGAHQALGLLGLRKASEGEGGGRLRRHLETEVQPGLVAPLLAIPRRRHEDTGLRTGVCIEAASHGPSPGLDQPKEPH